MSKEAASLDDRIADAFAGEQTSQTIAALLQEVQKTKHGRFTCEMIEVRREIAEISRQHRDMMALLSGGGQ